ncbi:MAG TPA: hypothetical protein VFA23_16855 [Dongiaceae bacterium]|nr:hypothetical protein [Dongiaceae bacterium]
MKAVKRVRARSTLPKPDARMRYINIGELEVLQQIRKDAKLLDDRLLAIGPFARLDAGAVAAHDGKTRGAITNLFGSQAAFQTETMARALSTPDWIQRIEYPAPGAFGTAEEWVDAFFIGQSARGPKHGAKPSVSYAFLWALWLGALPYGLWSKRISRPSMAEHRQWVRQLEDVFANAINHFALAMREGATVRDLANAAANLIEGVWLNQCLTGAHPCDAAQPIATALCRAGRMLWLGATKPRGPE